MATGRVAAAPAGRARRDGSQGGRLGAGRTVIGVVSDTHGLLRPEALRRLRGVDRIVHAGDVGTPEVLRALEAIAPVTAVRGNNDRGAWARALPETATLMVEGARFYVLHDVKTLAVDPLRAGVAAVIAGHSHQPSAGRPGRRALPEPRQHRPPPLHAAGRDGAPDGARRRRARPHRVPRRLSLRPRATLRA